MWHHVEHEQPTRKHVHVQNRDGSYLHVFAYLRAALGRTHDSARPSNTSSKRFEQRVFMRANSTEVERELSRVSPRPRAAGSLLGAP